MSDADRPDDSAAATATPAPAPPLPLVRRIGRWCLNGADLGAQGLARLLLTGLLLLVLALLTLAALPLTEPGTRWLIDHVLGHVPGLHITLQDPRGALLGNFSARELRVQLGQRNIVLHEPAWRGVDIRPPDADAPDWTLHVEQLRAARLTLSGPGSADPIVLPTTLGLPLQVRLARVELDRIELDTLPGRPIEHLALSLRLGAGRTARHQLDGLQLQWDRLDVRGSASLSAAEPLVLSADLALRPRQAAVAPAATPQAAVPQVGLPPPSAAPRPDDDWNANLQARGPLAGFALRASLKARGQSLDVQAQVRVADALPVSRLQASMAGLDLAALASGLPHTALSGELTADLGKPGSGSGAGGDLPLRLSAELTNARPARIDQGGLPLHRLRLQAASHAQNPSRGTVEALAVEFAGNTLAGPARAGAPVQPLAYTAAGTLGGSGSWQIHGDASRRLVLQTDASVVDLQPALLDPRAPAIVVSGPFSLGYEQNLAAASDAAPARSPVRGGSAGHTPAGTAAAPPRLTLSTDMSGRLSRRSAHPARNPLGDTRARAANAVPASAAALADDGLPPVRLRLKAGLSLDELRIEQLDAQSGNARLRGSGTAQRRPGGWHIDLNNSLEDFDPSLWWPGTADTPWQRGPHRLAGELQALLDLPDARPGADTLLARLAGLSGSTRLALRASLLAGVPVAGTLLLRSAGAGKPSSASSVPLTTAASEPAAAGLAAAAGRVQVQANISVGERADPDSALAGGGLGLSLQGQLDALGSDDNWQFSWQGRELDALTPWFRLAGSAWALHGDTRGSLAVQGRWPAMHSQGEIHAQQLLLISRPAVVADSTAPTRSLTISLQGLAGRWQAGSRLDEAAELDLALAGLRGAGLDLRDVQLSSRGSGQAHQITLHSLWQMPQAPSTSVSGGNAETDSSTTVVPRRWQLVLQARGGLSPTPPPGDPAGSAYTWNGQIDRLIAHDAGADPSALLRAETATDAAAAAFAVTPWLLRVAPTSLALGLGGGETSMHLGATRLQLGDAQLALDILRWRHRHAASSDTEQDRSTPAAADPHTDIDLTAQLQPYAVAPLLVRLQPGFGWRGNLRLGGRIELHGHSQGLNAELDVGRINGDLEVLDTDMASTPQRLGLRELRLGLQARNGSWSVSHRVDGSNLGRLDGELHFETRSSASWPARDDKLDGRLDLNVAQLGHWGRWLPAGWRLNGRLETSARLGGRLGAPEFSGELLGQQITVRNSLQGVNWTDARLRVALNGEAARIDEFVVKGGSGTLSATGQLRLSGSPRLDVALKADRFAALQRLDRRVVLSGTADLAVDASTTSLKGKLRADEGRIDVSQGDAPTLGDDVSVVRPQAGAAGAAASAASATQERAATTTAAAALRTRRGLLLDLRADLGDNFELRGRGITAQLGGQLQLTSPNDRLALNGTIRTVDGSYAAYGQKLSIDRGLITFTGPAENPRLDIQATRPDLDDVKVGVAITGTAQSPRVRLFSEPEMSNTDKLSWLLLGRASDGLGSTDLSLLQRAAFSLLAGESDSPSLVQRLGLDQIGVRQTEGTVRETIVSLGKQLSRRWYVGYERSLNAATGSWQLIYRLAQRFTLRAQSGIDNAVDLIWTWKWGPDTPEPSSAAP
jgi:translocation and assembly module TamB